MAETPQAREKRIKRYLRDASRRAHKNELGTVLALRAIEARLGQLAELLQPEGSSG